MKIFPLTAAILSPLVLLASCGASPSGDTAAVSTPAPTAGNGDVAFQTEALGSFNEPWAAEFAPGTQVLFVTEKSGVVKWFDTATKRSGTVTGAPRVDYGGQGGLGDIAFLPAQAGATVGTRTMYLSWAEAGDGDTRGAAVGRGQLVCSAEMACRIDGLQVIWRQPKVTGRGHYSHRFAISPDGQHLFVASGDRQKMDPAQDTTNNLGAIVRLNLDGTPAAGNPFSGQAGKAQDLWSWGHRNTLGLAFDGQGRLWNIEHGPAGGDEINLVERGKNYGWPLVAANAKHYDGRTIADHSTRSEFVAPAVSWTPVIAPGDFIIYGGSLFPQLRGQAIIGGMKPTVLVRVAFDGAAAREVGRHTMDRRIREVVEAPDGAILLLEDGEDGRLLRLTPG